MAFGLRPRSIHGELALLVGVLVLPFAALTAYLLYTQALRDFGEAQSVVRRLADSHAEQAARFLADTRKVLQTVAWRPLVRAMDAARCDPALRELLELYPSAANFLVVDREGRLKCGAIAPPRGRDLGAPSGAVLREILSAGSFAVSPPVRGRESGRWTIAAVQPVVGVDGAMAGTVSMTIDLAGWNLLALNGGLPEGTVVALLSGGVVIARTRGAEQWIGSDVTGSEVMARIGSKSAGVVRALGVNEIDRFWGFRRVPGTDWTVLAGIPSEQVVGPVRERSTRVGLLAALVVALAVAVAVAFARRLARPVGRIAEALRQRAAGRDDLPIPVSGPREVAAIAEELNRGFERSERLSRERESLLERLQMQLERMPLACLLFDAEARISYVNPAAERVFGWTAAEMLGQEAVELYIPAERRGLVEGIFARLRRGEYVAAAGESVRKDGSRVMLEWVNTPLLGRDDEFLGLMSMATDVTERERGKARLERTQRLLTALSEVNETVVRVRERDDLFRQVCRICVEHIHFLVATVALVDEAGRRVVPHVFAGPRGEVLRELAFPLDPREPLSATVTATAVRTKRAAVANDANADPTKAVARPIRERIGSKSTASFPLFQGGAVIGAFTLHSDAQDFFDAPMIELLTRMADDISFALDKLAEQDQLGALTRELEERVRRRTAELEAANTELEAFSYSVSHDLRAPVRHVDGFVRLLEKELASPSPKVAHYLATISAAARRMGALIDDLLALSRTGRQSLDLRRVDLGAMVRELLRELGPDAGKRGVQWTIGELPAVMADPSLLRVVLHNLLSNALKYTRAQPMARIAVEARPGEPGAVEITVRDNGVGFDPRFKDKLFGVFQRLHRDEEFEGTGIGLATARRIVHRHGHRIWATGELGKGAAFTFTITQAEVAHASGADIAG